MNRLESIKRKIDSESSHDNHYLVHNNDVRYLLQRLERYETALQYIITAQDYDDYWPANIAEEALKEE